MQKAITFFLGGVLYMKDLCFVFLLWIRMFVNVMLCTRLNVTHIITHITTLTAIYFSVMVQEHLRVQRAQANPNWHIVSFSNSMGYCFTKGILPFLQLWTIRPALENSKQPILMQNKKKTSAPIRPKQ